MRTASNWRRRVGVLAALALALTACGEGSTEPSGDEASASAETSEPSTEETSNATNGSGEVEDARGVTDSTITLGAILDLSGPYNAAGVLMRDGIEAWVAQTNEQGGIDGRELTVIYEDNKSDPSATLAAAEKLIFNDEVFALVGVHGAAAFGAILELVEEEEVISFSLGLSEEMYNPLREHVFVAAVPYAHQTGRGMAYFQEAFDQPAMGVLYQDDEFGESGLAGFDAAADELGFEVVARETFVRGADDLSGQVRALVDAEAEAVACVCIYTQSGLLRRELGRLDAADLPVFAINPSVGAPYFEIAGDSAGNFYAAEYYAHPGDPGFDEANAAVQSAYGRDATTFDLFGLVNAAVLFQAMEDAEQLTSASVVEALEGMQGVEVPGFVSPVEFGPDRRVASFESAIYEAVPDTQEWERVAEPAPAPGM